MNDYLKDIDLLEEPLVGINYKLHDVCLRSQMTDEELRAWIQEVRTKRESIQTRKAAMELRKDKGSAEPSKVKVEKLFEDF